MSYYDYDEEPVYEPMPEFLEKIQELVTEQVKIDRSEMVKEMDDLKKHNASLYNKNLELSRQVGNMSTEIKKQVDAAKKEFEREMFGGFLRGDPMFYAGFDYESTPCETCKGTGSLLATLGDGKEVRVSCFGKDCKGGQIKQGLYVVRETRVKRMALYGDEYGKATINIYFKSAGSYSESDLNLSQCFKSVEEAQKRCDELTAKHRKEIEEREQRNKK